MAVTRNQALKENVRQTGAMFPGWREWTFL